MAQVSITPFRPAPLVKPLDFSKPFDLLFKAVMKRNEREKNEGKRVAVSEGFNDLRSDDPDTQMQGFNTVLENDSNLAATAFKFLEPGMKQALEKQKREEVATLRDSVLAGDKNALNDLSPDEVDTVLKIKASNNEADQAAERTRVAGAANNATEILKGGTNRAQLNTINLMLENIKSNPNLTEEEKNASIQDLVRLGEMPFEGRAIALNKTKRAARAFDKILGTAFAPEEQPGGIVPTSDITGGFVVKENPNGTFTTTQVLNEAQLSNANTGKFSAVTTTYDNGTVLQAGPQGSIRVTDPSGKEIPTGPERVTVLKKAREEQINFAQLKAQATKAGSDATTQATKFFNETQKLKKSIGNINSAITLLDKGAQTGPILSRLPSVRSLSIQLDNVQKSMGLDVIGNTTFGALSKGELDLALSKALPTGLGQVELRNWLVTKRDTQNKLVEYMQSAAIFLNKPGNDIPGWIEAQKSLQTTPTVSPSTGETPSDNQASPFTIKRIR